MYLVEIHIMGHELGRRVMGIAVDDDDDDEYKTSCCGLKRIPQFRRFGSSQTTSQIRSRMDLSGLARDAVGSLK